MCNFIYGIIPDDKSNGEKRSTPMCVARHCGMSLTCLRSVNASCKVPSLKPGTGSEFAKTERKGSHCIIFEVILLIPEI